MLVSLPALYQLASFISLFLCVGEANKIKNKISITEGALQVYAEWVSWVSIQAEWACCWWWGEGMQLKVIQEARISKHKSIMAFSL